MAGIIPAPGSINIKLLDTDDMIVSLIMAGLASKANDVIDRAARKSISPIGDVVQEAVFNCPEMVELRSGVLRGEFGLTKGKAQSASQDIAKRVGDSIMVRAHKVTSLGSSSKLRGGIEILIQPIDFGNVLSSPLGMIRSEKGVQLQWLEWLLTLGDAVIVDVYEFMAKTGKGRSGLGAMAEMKTGIWRVPPEYAGTEDKNFITKALDNKKIGDKIASILQKNMM